MDWNSRRQFERVLEELSVEKNPEELERTEKNISQCVKEKELPEDINYCEQNTNVLWELVGYDGEDDHYLVNIGEVFRFVTVSSARLGVHTKIFKGGRIHPSVFKLGVNFDSYDKESEHMIMVLDAHDDLLRKVSSDNIQERLQSSLQNGMD
jgi:hypothetical protein